MGTWSVFDTDQSMSWLTTEALSCGVRLFDTSAMYGRAEQSLARALGKRRKHALITTKISAKDTATTDAQIRQPLGLFSTIDLYQIHNIVGWRMHLPRLCQLKKEGQIRSIGISQGCW